MAFAAALPHYGERSSKGGRNLQPKKRPEMTTDVRTYIRVGDCTDWCIQERRVTWPLARAYTWCGQALLLDAARFEAVDVPASFAASLFAGEPMRTLAVDVEPEEPGYAVASLGMSYVYKPRRISRNNPHTGLDS